MKLGAGLFLTASLCFIPALFALIAFASAAERFKAGPDRHYPKATIYLVGGLLLTALIVVNVSDLWSNIQ